MPPSPPTAADELHWRELQLAQRRNLEGSFLHLGIPESAQHEIWLRGYQAGGAAQYGESSRATGPAQFPQTEQQVKPEPAMPVPQSANEDLKGPTKRTIKMYSDRLEKWFTLTANFDSGTTENWITKNVVDLLQHVIVTVPYTKYQTFSGETLDSSLLVHDILWHGDGTSARSRSTDFRVIGNSAPFEVLFGSDFIFSESVYSFNEANLILTKVKETPDDRRNREINRAKADAEAKLLAQERKMIEAPPKNIPKFERSTEEKVKGRRR